MLTASEKRCQGVTGRALGQPVLCRTCHDCQRYTDRQGTLTFDWITNPSVTPWGWCPDKIWKMDVQGVDLC